MKRIVLGVDHRYGSIAFLATAIIAGILLRSHEMAQQEVAFLGGGLCLLTGAIGLFYLGFSTNYMRISKYLLSNPADAGLRARLESLMGMRRRAAIGFGVAAAGFNSILVLYVNGRDVFSFLSLALLLASGVFLSFRWFNR